MSRSKLETASYALVIPLGDEVLYDQETLRTIEPSSFGYYTNHTIYYHKVSPSTPKMTKLFSKLKLIFVFDINTAEPSPKMTKSFSKLYK